LKQIRKRLTYANVMSSLSVFLILGGATAFAAVKKVGPNEIKANSIKTGKIVKEAVTAGKIKKNAITEAKIADNAVTTNKIANDAVIGTKVNESTLSEVPSAAKATTAANLTGQISVFARLGFGQSETIASNGAVSLVAECQNNVAGNDRIRILAQTTANGSILDGTDDRTGPATFLDVGTPADERELTANSVATGSTNVDSEIDQGVVMDPSGKTIVINSEGFALGLNYAGSQCLVAGVVNLLG
jgi:hypothetical protein